MMVSRRLPPPVSRSANPTISERVAAIHERRAVSKNILILASRADRRTIRDRQVQALRACPCRASPSLPQVLASDGSTATSACVDLYTLRHGPHAASLDRDRGGVWPWS